MYDIYVKYLELEEEITYIINDITGICSTSRDMEQGRENYD